MKLNEVEVGSTVTVKKIEGDGAYKRRIMDMGITKGVELYIRKVAPLGDPVEITVRGYEMCIIDRYMVYMGLIGLSLLGAYCIIMKNYIH